MEQTPQTELPEGELFVPGYANYLVCADEAATDGGDYYGFGSLWMPWERRGDFAALIRAARRVDHYDGPIRWDHIERAPDLFVDLVHLFFRRRWLMFHMLVVRERDVNMELHDGNRLRARRRHFAMFLRKKIGDFGATRDKTYHLRIAPMTANMTSELSRRVNRSLNTEIGTQSLASVTERSLDDTPGIGLSDVLVTAVMAAREGRLLSPAEQAVSDAVADCLGWPDLTTDTFPQVDKFNIWRFWDGSETRYESTRRVDLKYPTGRLVRR